MAKRLILLPLKDDAQTVDFLGAKVEGGEIRTSYGDCAKVLVDGSDKDVAELAKASKAHFEQLWRVGE
jgi:hypothetical protein